MSMSYRPTVREIDKTLTRVLRRVRALEREVPHRLRPPTRPLGPNSFRRTSAGHLVTAALAGLAVGRWSQGLNLPEERFFEAELERRGLEKSLATWRGEDTAEDSDTILLGTDHFDQHADHTTVITVNSLAGMASALDRVFLGGDGHEPSALSPAELIEDMQAVGMHPDAVAAYGSGIGASEVSITDELAHQQEISKTGVVLEDGVAAEDTMVL